MGLLPAAAAQQPYRRKTYPKYRDSGESQFGVIPTHWELIRIKHLCPFQYGNSLSADTREQNGLVPVYGSNGMIGYHSVANTTGPALIIGRKGSYGKINYADSPCFAIDTTYFVDSKHSKADIRWLYYALSILNLDGYSQDSAIPGLSREYAHNQWLTHLPISEQRAIADFLDRETDRIDALITKKQRLIELLQEKRSALISHAVTKGLDGGVAMKESGVPWLGQVPAHWEIRPLRAVVQLRRGFDLTVAQREAGTVPVYSSSGLSGYHDTALVKGPGVVTGRYGTVGQIFYVEDDFWPMNTALYGKEFWGNDPQYVSYLLTILPFDAYSGKSAVPGIDRNDLDPIKVVCPPRDEQLAIASYLVRAGWKLEQAVQRIETAIVKLQEYRTALISAAVTGKIDVRG